MLDLLHMPTRRALAELAKALLHVSNIACLPKDEMQFMAQDALVRQSISTGGWFGWWVHFLLFVHFFVVCWLCCFCIDKLIYVLCSLPPRPVGQGPPRRLRAVCLGAADRGHAAASRRHDQVVLRERGGHEQGTLVAAVFNNGQNERFVWVELMVVF
jgi:hypothetical protein